MYICETIDLSPIAKYIHPIGCGFLCDATSLEKFDAQELNSLGEIGSYFLVGALVNNFVVPPANL